MAQGRNRKYLIYLIILISFYILISVALLSGREFYRGDDYSVYANAVMLAKSSSIKEFYSIYMESFDRVILFRIVPFLWIFGVTWQAFRLSAIALNAALAIILYLKLEDATTSNKAFRVMLLLLSGYVFLELMSAPGVELAFMLVCGIYFSQLLEFVNGKDSRGIVLTVAMMFILKATTYLILPVFTSFMLAYYFCNCKTRSMKSAAHFLLFHLLGYIAYMLIFTGIDMISFADHMTLDFHMTLDPHSAVAYDGMEGIARGMQSFLGDTGISLELDFLKASPSIVFTMLTLALFAYLFMRKNRILSLMFLSSKISLFLIFNVIHRYPHGTYMLPFYPIYMMMLAEMSEEIRIPMRNFIALISAVFIFHVAIFSSSQSNIYSERSGIVESSIARDILDGLLPGEVYVEHSSVGPGVTLRECVPLPMIDPGVREFLIYTEGGRYAAGNDLFLYALTDDIKEAEYIICKDCKDPSFTGFSLVSGFNFEKAMSESCKGHDLLVLSRNAAYS
jgi:hypothetical protein